jgi:nicotinamidase-related amidase
LLRIPFNKAALLVIDVQPTYCAYDGLYNYDAEQIAKKIAKTVPSFRSIGMPVYVVYYDKKKRPISEISFHHFKPAQHDIAIAKNADSAFRGSNIDRVLKHKGHKHLLITGFNHNVCVFKTVLDALRKNYDVSVLKDLTGNESINDPFGDEHESYSRIMQQRGAVITDSKKVLKALKQ